jgi:signal transduction protein with GAF and PtsI domain
MTGEFLAEIQTAVSAEDGWNKALALVMKQFGAESGTIHLLGEGGLLHLKAASAGIPEFVLDKVRTIPVGKGMAGLAVERKEPVTTCNIQTDTSGDVRAGAKATGLQGSLVVPILRDGAAVGALGIANQRERTFTEAETEWLLRAGRVLGTHPA